MGPFRVAFRGRQGATVISDDPRIDADRQVAWLRARGSTYSMMAHLDGAFTVNGDGGMITFARAGTPNGEEISRW